MNRILRIAFAAAGLLLANAGLLEAQTTLTGPLQLLDSSTYNWSAFLGSPTSTNRNSSDGQSVNTQPNPFQWQGYQSFSGNLGRTTNSPALTGINTTAATPVFNAFSNSVVTEFPYGTNQAGAIVLVQRQARIGGNFFLQANSILFGQVIPPPANTENNTNAPANYWVPEPYTTSNHVGDPFYWSPNARQIYGSQSGPIQITWVKATPYATKPAYTNLLNPAASFETNAGNFYELFTVNYTVSGTAVKTPQLMYWTEGPFASSGKIVTLPSRGVQLNIVYNNLFTGSVSNQYVDPYQSSPNTVTNLNTLYVSSTDNNLHAFNKEGRVFVEVLGDLNTDGVTHQQLGIEIVDVFRQPNPSDVTAYLGERLLPPPPGVLTNLVPSLIVQGNAISFVFQQTFSTADVRYYAIETTANENDLLMYWLDAGVAGLQWPFLLGRYHTVWPADVTMYDQYVRPVAVNQTAAAASAVALPGTESPSIVFQDLDPLPDPNGEIIPQRAQLTGNSMFYTYLDSSFPVQRSLVQFTLGNYVSFERVLSWLDTTLSSPTNATGLSNSVALNLNIWNTNTATNWTVSWPSGFSYPRVITGTATVGRRITAPDHELGSTAGSAYAPGHINTATGNYYDVNDYIDPLTAGFAAAASGAIIPVNTKGSSLLEVWWFRTNNVGSVKNPVTGGDNDGAGFNAGNANLGFSAVYWPSVIGYYTIGWPTGAPQIVLASGKGNEPSNPTANQLAGTIYYQNNPALDGYNPNEEHALVSSGTAYALRDDLNITNVTAANYSSQPFVLLDYIDPDGRPNMVAYQVMREDPAHGIVFDYIQTAGQVLQPPEPLGLFDNLRSTEPVAQAGDLPTINGATAWLDSSDTNGPYALYKHFTYLDRNNTVWVYRGLNAGPPPMQAGTYAPATATVPSSFTSTINATAVVGTPFQLYIQTSRQSQFLSTTFTNTSGPLPGGLTITASTNGVIVSFTPTNTASYPLTVVVKDSTDPDTNANSVTVALNLTAAAASGTVVTQGPLAITSLNSYTGTVITFSNRPPFLALSAVNTNSFTMQYWYPSQPGFYYPSLPFAQQPAPLTLVPFLRKIDGLGGFLNGDGTSTNTAPLTIVYRPVWPAMGDDGKTPVPSMEFGRTLTTEINRLPDVKDMATARVLYQQSIATNFISLQTGKTNQVNPSVVLFDPTVDKVSDLESAGLSTLPASVASTLYNGFTYFQNLPPQLKTLGGSAVLYLDPNRGTNGSLVLQGYSAETLSDGGYVYLNALSGPDLTNVINLCASTDVNFAAWKKAVMALSYTLETYGPSTSVPGTFAANTNLNISFGVTNVVAITSDESPVVNYALSAAGPGAGYVVLLENGGRAFGGENPVAMHIFKISRNLYQGELEVVPDPNPLSEKTTFRFTGDFGGNASQYEFQWKSQGPNANGTPPVADATMSQFILQYDAVGLNEITVGGANAQSISDNFVTMRYRPTNSLTGLTANWSPWINPPAFEPGWIKRVLTAINPFDQRTTDLLDNAVDTDVSIISQAGARWEGDVALNATTLNNDGLIAIYETVLNRGESLTINAGINNGGANDALLLAAGYLSDLYMDLGNTAWADSLNPTIGIGTDNENFGAQATSLFSFMGEVPSLLEEQLALVRGRDDILSPGVDLAPVYNRLYWNYTAGINSGEIIYALNYNVVPDPSNTNGIITAADAEYMFPQGHGDAYGHYLTALFNYYKLFMNQNFDWRPATEIVSVLGANVQVGYMHEQKFAASAGALATAGQQAFSLAWLEEYQPVHSVGWSQYGTGAVLTNKTTTLVRYWGADHWATRTGQGAYLNWLVGNAIVPALDTNAADIGTIQQIDRTTIPQLPQLAGDNDTMQAQMDNMDGGISPLGVPADAIAFDLDPNGVVGTTNGTHFEQIYSRAVVALNNAVASFNDAQNVTQEMRQEQNSASALAAGVASQEAAYNNSLIEVYGTPYPDDVGPGGTYAQGYSGPDLIHYMYVDRPESTFSGLLDPTQPQTNTIAATSLGAGWEENLYSDASFMTNFSGTGNVVTNTFGSTNYQFVLGPDGFFGKPANWTGERAAMGSIQQAIANIIKAHDAASTALYQANRARNNLNNAVQLFSANAATIIATNELNNQILELGGVVSATEAANELAQASVETTLKINEAFAKAAEDALPKVIIVGLADGGDELAPEESAEEFLSAGAQSVLLGIGLAAAVSSTAVVETEKDQIIELTKELGELNADQAIMNAAAGLQVQVGNMANYLTTINQSLQNLSGAMGDYRTQVYQGRAIQQNRAAYRAKEAAIIQGYRTEDAAFILFRNEKLQRYLSLFNLAGMYSLLAANAYDYETGLLDTPAGRAYVNSIVNARSLGVVLNGQPQVAGSDGGDPGLASALAQMMGDFQVLKGRLGLNNPDAYGTTVSLRAENYRILPTDAGTNAWRQVLQAAYMPDLLQDGDARRMCLQLDPGNNQPVPGIEIVFSTTIADGLNLFGLPLAEGDHNFSPSSFATKIFAVGVDFEGYIGMDAPNGNNPTGTNSVSLNPLALAATPYCYLIPVGVDSMRVPLGDSTTIRNWSVQDVAIPLPYNIGDSDMSTLQLWTSSQSLTEPLFALRMHEAFRPVPSASYFSDSLYGASGSLLRSQYTNNRLVARSVWNSQWKLIIPGYTLLNDPNAGLQRFMATVSDIKLHFVTYSYSGN